MFITIRVLKNQKNHREEKSPRMFCFSYLSLCDKLPQNSDQKSTTVVLPPQDSVGWLKFARVVLLALCAAWDSDCSHSAEKSLSWNEDGLFAVSTD